MLALVISNMMQKWTANCYILCSNLPVCEQTKETITSLFFFFVILELEHKQKRDYSTLNSLYSILLLSIIQTVQISLTSVITQKGIARFDYRPGQIQWEEKHQQEEPSGLTATHVFLLNQHFLTIVQSDVIENSLGSVHSLRMEPQSLPFLWCPQSSSSCRSELYYK